MVTVASGRGADPCFSSIDQGPQAQRDQFTDPQRMPVSHHDKRGIPETVAANTSGGLHQGFDFTRRQVLPAAALCVGDPVRRAYRLTLSHLGTLTW